MTWRAQGARGTDEGQAMHQSSAGEKTVAPAVRDISGAELRSALRRGWWKALLGLILGLGLAAAFVVTQAPTYTSVTMALVRPSTDDATSVESLAAEDLAQARAATYESLGNSVVVADEVRRDLGLKTSPEDLLEQVTVVSTPETTGLEITATADSADGAAELAGAWRDALSDAADADGSSGAGDRVSIEPAGEPTVPATTSGLSDPAVLVVGGAVGLLVGILVAVGTARPARRA